MPARILPFPELLPWRNQLAPDTRVVATNGCFDILHAGHVRYLQTAKSLGDFLIVGLNSDASVRSLKGPTRPLNPESDRAEVLAALACVDAVCVFPDTRATAFLRAARPHLYVKGGDYSLESLDPEEVAAVQSSGGSIRILPLLPGRSTTEILARLSPSRP